MSKRFDFWIILLGSLSLAVLFGLVIQLDIKFQQTDFKMNFEHADIISFNKQYLRLFKMITFKYNRTWPVINCTFEFAVDVGRDIEIITQAYVFLSNEYRYFPLRLEVNLCEALYKNYVGINEFSKCGNFTGCPLEKGKIYHFCNWAPDESQYPPFIPNGKYKLELQALYHDIEVFVVQAFGTVYRPIKIPLIGK